MPPTPFAPSHSTPFKSTLSSAMHGRRDAPLPAAASSTSWPPSADTLLAALDARDWRFLAEGGANLLVAWAGAAPSPWVGPHGERLALRLTKRSRAGPSSSSSSSAPLDAGAWREQVIAPLLGDGVAGVLPATVCVPLESVAAQAFVAQLAARIEMDRPAARRRVDGIDTHAAQLWAVEDLSAPDAHGAEVLLMEIKPKWGFLPSPAHLDGSSAPHKGTTSRYRMHRVLKAPHAVERTHLEQTYDPLQLYASDEQSRAAAVEALTREWRWGEWPQAGEARGKKSNNLKVFLKGKEVDTSSRQELEAWRSHLLAASSGGSIDLDSLDSLTHAMLSVLRPALSAGSPLGVALRRLAQLQRRLDALDVEGLAARWRSETGCAFGTCQEADALLAPPTLDEYTAVVRLFLAHEERLGHAPAPAGDEEAAECEAVRQTQQLLRECPLRHATLAFLLSATFKDCSVMLRCLPAAAPDGARAWRVEVRLIDLDAKPLAKLGHYAALDREIVDCFAAWRAAQE